MGRNTVGWGQERRSDYAAPVQRRAFATTDATQRPLSAHAQASPATSRPVTHRAKRPKRRVHTVVWPKMRRYATIAFLVYLAVLCAGVLDLLQMRQVHDSYQLSADTQKLLGAAVSSNLVGKITYDGQKQQYVFNANYKPDGNAIKVGGGQYSATLGQDIQKDGLSLTDPASNITVTLKPTFTTMPGKNQSGRLIYPLNRAGDQMVYSVRGNGLKEDIVLPAYQGDSAQFSYTFDLPTGTEARMLPSGGVGIYSSNPTLFGNISYGSDKDKALVDKARINGAKNNLVFGLPAPIIKNVNGVSKATAKFVLSDNTLTVEASGLKNANYPLTIDPSVVVTGATDFQAGNSSAQGNNSLPGNNDDNIDFSVAGQVGRAGLSAGTVGTFNAGNAPTGIFGHGSVVYNGYLYLVAGHTSSAYTTSVQSSDISSGAPAAWNTNATVGTAISGNRDYVQAVAYNGYIYVLGGQNGSSPFNDVQYALLCTANNSGTGGCTGTAGTVGNWTSTSVMTSNRWGFGAVAYNGYMYAVGGCPGIGAGVCGQNTQLSSTETAPINANGTLGTWTTSGATAMSTGRFGFGFAFSNGYIYVAGGCSVMGLGTCSTSNNDVVYAKLGPGTIGAWASAGATFTTARQQTSAVVTQGYLYVMGGQQGSTWFSDVQFAPINADGTIGSWTTNSNSMVSTRTLNTAVGYNGYIYGSGGCAASSCASTVRADSDYAQINTAGGTNTLNSRQTGTAIPNEGVAGSGRYAQGVIALNGFLYEIGGCVEDTTFNQQDCGNTFTGLKDTINTIRWATINADGTIGASWTADTLTNANRLNGANGLAAFGLVAIENTIYAVGGFDGNNNAWTRSVSRITMDPSTGAPSSTTWTATANVLPAAYGFMGAVYENNNATTGYIYSIGGCFASPAGGLGCSTYQTTVCAIAITLSTGAPTACSTSTPATQTQLSTALGLMGFAYGGGYVYLIGGANATNNQNITIYYSALTGNGITGSWSTATGTLPFSGGTAPNINGDRRAPAIYSNGHILLLGGHNGNTGTTLSAIYDCQIDPSSGNIPSNCSTSGQTLSSTRWNSGAAAANGFIYDIGGCSAGGPPTSCSSISTAVDIYRINYGGVGATDTWTTASNSLPVAAYGASITAYDGHLYEAGGCSDSGAGCTTALNTVRISTIGADPTASRLGSWSTTNMGTLTVSRGSGEIYAVNGYLYDIGGFNGSTAQATYDYAKILTDGTGQLASDAGCGSRWCSAAIPSARFNYAGFLYGGKIYICGGIDSGSAKTNTTYVATPQTNGTLSWATATNNFTGIRAAFAGVGYNGYIYVAGGGNGVNYLQDVQFAQVQADGTPGTWNYTASLPYRLGGENLVAADGFIYVIAGNQANGTTCNNQAWSSSIASNGQIHTFQQNSNTFSTTRDYAASTYYDGYVYLAGGNCNIVSGSAPTATIVYAGLLAQPAVSQFSQELDTGLDTNPINMYIQTARGSSTGSQINFSYLSAPNSSAAFGKLTKLFNLSDATTVYTLSALNGSGTVIDGNRYYLMMFTIDDSQSFSFPEAPAQETAITAYEMYYHPNTGARLRNGKTFTNQIQQSLDAHP